MASKGKHAAFQVVFFISLSAINSDVFPASRLQTRVVRIEKQSV